MSSNTKQVPSLVNLRGQLEQITFEDWLSSYPKSEFISLYETPTISKINYFKH